MRKCLVDIMNEAPDEDSGSQEVPVTEGMFHITELSENHPIFMQLTKPLIRELMFEADVTLMKEGEVLYE